MSNIKFYKYIVEYFSNAKPGHTIKEKYTSIIACPNQLKKYLKKIGVDVVSIKKDKNDKYI